MFGWLLFTFVSGVGARNIIHFGRLSMIKKQKTLSIGQLQNTTIFHWPIAKTKLFSIGHWLLTGHQTHQLEAGDRHSGGS